MDDKTQQSKPKTIAFVGNHTPRQCGIATFTADISASIRRANPECDTFVVAFNDSGRSYVYPDCVRLQVDDSSLASYRSAADYLNVHDVSVVSLQHEYGIFGGRAGGHILTLLRALRMPLVTTLHTVLAGPHEDQKDVLDEICHLSERIVVMSATAVRLLQTVHGVPLEKIDVIPHGTPVLPDRELSRRTLGIDEKRVLLTFGLLSPDKGVEYLIDALPEITCTFPDVVCLIVGATHPNVRREQGEAYRLMLQERVRRHHLGAHVSFYDRFVSDSELGLFLAAADIYIAPSLNMEQITSGTLAYAVGGGRAAIATASAYAKEILGDERGLLVPPRDPAAIARNVCALLANPDEKMRIEARAASLGRSMSWPVVADALLVAFGRAIGSSRTSVASQPRTNRAFHPPALMMPEIKLDHLVTMSDSTGLLQHARWSVPRYEEGYCLDDNARGLILMALIDEGRMSSSITLRLASVYMAFVAHAFEARTARFKNFMRYSRTWVDGAGSEDSHGRALWALGTVMGRTKDGGRRHLARELFDAALPATLAFTSPRAWSFALLGIHEAVRAGELNDRTTEIGRSLAERLLDLYRNGVRKGWPWFEPRLTYCNARLPQAMLVSGAWLERHDMSQVGQTSLEWLTQKQTRGDLFAPIGTRSYHVDDQASASFDQQPVEAWGTVSACLSAYRATSEEKWLSLARQSFDWFLGRNHHEAWLYDPTTGGCRDGLHEDRLNENQGAESTLSFLLALVEMRQELPRSLESELPTAASSRGARVRVDAVASSAP